MTARVRGAGTWQRLAGKAFGLAQPAFLGPIDVRAASEAEAAAVAAALAAVLDEAPPVFGAAIAPEERIARLLAFAMGAVQRQSRIAVSDGYHVAASLDAASAGFVRFDVGVPADRAPAAAAALQWVVDGINTVDAGPPDGARAAQARRRAQEQLGRFSEGGVNRFLMIRAAQRRDIPVRPWIANTLLIGTGSQARWMRSTLTDATPSIGVTSARHKMRTAAVLREAGLPGAQHVLAESPEAAVQAAVELGYPVVVKPEDMDKGEGVAADLRDAQAVARAWHEAAAHSKRILVEKWAPGFTHRLNVFEGRVNRVARRVAGGVVGDGTATIAELVRRRQDEPTLREFERLLGRPPFALDDEAMGLLAQRGLPLDAVPAPGEYVRLRRRDNINAGGSNEELDPSDAAHVHPDNIRLAVDAARLLRLDIAGVDLIMEDIARSWLDTGALICEINAQPQVIVVSVVDDMVSGLLRGGNGRIPAQLFVAPSDAARREALVRRLVAAGDFEGVSCASGLHVGGVRVSGSFDDGFAAAAALLLRPDVGSAACVLGPADIASKGLPLDRWDSVHFEGDAVFAADEAAPLALARRYLGLAP